MQQRTEHNVKIFPYKFAKLRFSQGAQMVKNLSVIQEIQVQSLVRELRSYMPHGTAKKKKKKRSLVTLEQNTVYWIWQQRNSLVTLATTVSEERKK